MHPTVRPKLLYTTEWNIQKSESKVSHSTPKLTTKWNIQRLEPKASYHIPKFMICNKWNILITVDRNPSMHSQIGKDTKHP